MWGLQFLNGVALLHPACFQHPGIKPRPRGLAELLYKLQIVHAGGQGRAGDAGGGDLEQNLTHPETVANAHGLFAEAREGQVFAKRTGQQCLAQLFHPPVVILGAVDIHCLVGAAVVLLVGDVVAHQPQSGNLSGFNWVFVDAGGGGTGADLQGPWAAQVNGNEAHGVYSTLQKKPPGQNTRGTASQAFTC